MFRNRCIPLITALTREKNSHQPVLRLYNDVWCIIYGHVVPPTDEAVIPDRVAPGHYERTWGAPTYRYTIPPLIVVNMNTASIGMGENLTIASEAYRHYVFHLQGNSPHYLYRLKPLRMDSIRSIVLSLEPGRNIKYQQLSAVAACLGLKHLKLLIFDSLGLYEAIGLGKTRSLRLPKALEGAVRSLDTLEISGATTMIKINEFSNEVKPDAHVDAAFLQKVAIIIRRVMAEGKREITKEIKTKLVQGQERLELPGTTFPRHLGEVVFTSRAPEKFLAVAPQTIINIPS